MFLDEDAADLCRDLIVVRFYFSDGFSPVAIKAQRLQIFKNVCATINKSQNMVDVVEAISNPIKQNIAGFASWSLILSDCRSYRLGPAFPNRAS